MSQKETVLSNYRTPGLPSAFSASGNFKRLYPFVSRAKIDHELSKIDSFTLHKKTSKPKTNPMYVHHRRHLMEIDLIDISGLKQWNNNITFLLVLIDCFTRFVCVEPLTSKTGLSVAKALRNIFDNRLPPPVGIKYRFDRGTEFLNAHVKRLLKDRNIEYFHPANKPSHVERVNRTLQSILYQFLEEHETKRYIDRLQDIVKTYNSRPHRIIKMSPIEADLPMNQLLVQKALALYYSKREKGLGRKKKKPKYVIDQIVRIKASRGTFARGYEPIFKHEVFRIKSVITNLPRVMYTITDWNRTEDIEGSFYEEELTPHNSETFKIVAVLKERVRRGKRESLVQWAGYSVPSWELTSKVKKLMK